MTIDNLAILTERQRRALLTFVEEARRLREDCKAHSFLKMKFDEALAELESSGMPVAWSPRTHVKHSGGER